MFNTLTLQSTQMHKTNHTHAINSINAIKAGSTTCHTLIKKNQKLVYVRFPDGFRRILTTVSDGFLIDFEANGKVTDLEAPGLCGAGRRLIWKYMECGAVRRLIWNNTDSAVPPGD